jgi:hypothetical protein
MVIEMIQNSIDWKYLTTIPLSNLDAPDTQLKQVGSRSFTSQKSAEGAPYISTKIKFGVLRMNKIMSSEGAISISNDDRNDSILYRLLLFL